MSNEVKTKIEVKEKNIRCLFPLLLVCGFSDLGEMKLIFVLVLHGVLLQKNGTLPLKLDENPYGV